MSWQLVLESALSCQNQTQQSAAEMCSHAAANGPIVHVSGVQPHPYQQHICSSNTTVINGWDWASNLSPQISRLILSFYT